ncbi:MAG: hypothetical protein K8T26_20180 [Lentisphaerae bacterium]|nr:hypothetical protein [Lentisphaerota bacterium]
MDIQERVQTLVYSLGEGLGRACLRGLIAAVVVVLVLGLYVAQQFRGLREGASMEWAQLGRNVAAGRGFTTDCLRPVDAALLSRATSPESLGAGLPDLRHAPAYPAWLALGFRLWHPAASGHAAHQALAAERRVVLPLAFVCLVLCGMLVMAVGERLFDARVGTTAMVVFAISSGVLAAGISGGPAPLEMMLTTASVASLLAACGLRAKQAHAVAWLPFIVLGGLCAGAAALTAYRLFALVVVGVVLLRQGFVRWRGLVVALFLIAALGVVAPWMVRNIQACGNPFGFAPHATLNGTTLVDAVDGWDRLRVPAAGESRDVVWALSRKVAHNFGELYRQGLPALGDGLVMAFFFVALFYRFEEDLAGGLKWALMLGLALCMTTAAFGQPSARDLVSFLPLVIVVGVALLYKLLDQALFLTDDIRQAIVIAWVALAAIPLLLTLAGPSARRPYPPYAPPFVEYVCGLLKPGEILATDIPWAVAWYGGRSAMLLPRTSEDLVVMKREGAPVGAVYLTTETGDRPYLSTLLQGEEASWLPLLNQFVPSDFPWQHGFTVPPGCRDQLVLTDATRWAPAGAGTASDATAVP